MSESCFCSQKVMSDGELSKCNSAHSTKNVQDMLSDNMKIKSATSVSTSIE